jgi:hypothetical protein
MAENFKTYEGKPSTIPEEAGSRTGAGHAGPSRDASWHRRHDRLAD